MLQRVCVRPLTSGTQALSCAGAVLLAQVHDPLTNETWLHGGGAVRDSAGASGSSGGSSRDGGAERSDHDDDHHRDARC